MSGDGKRGGAPASVLAPILDSTQWRAASLHFPKYASFVNGPALEVITSVFSMGPLIFPSDNTGETTKAKTRRVRPFVIPLVVLAVLGVFAGGPILGTLYYLSGLENYTHQAHFDSNAWRNRTLDGDPMWPTRLRMVDDLMKRHLLDGRSREQVESLLGPGRPSHQFAAGDLIYCLGPERSFFRIDSECLVIRFDTSARVKNYRLVTD